MPEFMNCSLSPINIPSALIANGLGVCLMLVILFSSYRQARFITRDGRMFIWMCYLCLALCLLEAVGFLLDGSMFQGARPIIILSSVSLYFLSSAIAFLWICYVDYKLFGDHDRLRYLYSWASIPAVLVCLMAFANLFFPVFFQVDSNNVYSRTPLFFLPCLVSFCYLTYGAVLARYHRSRVDRYLFMPVMTFVIPIYIGGVIQVFFYGLALIWAATALGLTFLYINLQNEETFLDPLTNLYNRNYLFHYISRLIRRERGTISLIGILLDVNGFKQINDIHGHIQGDQVLQRLGDLLLRTVDRGVVFRYGGDEFLILIENASLADAHSLISAIQAELQRSNDRGDFPSSISFSAGTAVLTGSDVYHFFQEMDRNMYSEKRLFHRSKAVPPQ